MQIWELLARAFGNGKKKSQPKRPSNGSIKIRELRSMSQLIRLEEIDDADVRAAIRHHKEKRGHQKYCLDG